MLLMSKAMRREVSKLLRNDSRICYGPDAFGRECSHYGGVPIRVIEEDHEGNTILGFDETQGEDEDTGPSMPCVSERRNTSVACRTR